MRRPRLLLALAAVVVLAAGCLNPQPEPPGMPTPEELMAIGVDYQRAWENGDAEAISRFFADNAVVMVDQEPVRGPAAIRDRWLVPSLRTMSDFRASPEHFVEGDGQVMESGRYAFRESASGQPRMVSGTYAQLWVRQSDGTWKIQSLMAH